MTDTRTATRAARRAAAANATLAERTTTIAAIAIIEAGDAIHADAHNLLFASTSDLRAVTAKLATILAEANTALDLADDYAAKA